MVHYLHPGFNLDEVSTHSYEITIPGLYMGLNEALHSSLINFMPMQCNRYKEGATAVDSDDEGVTKHDIAGK